MGFIFINIARFKWPFLLPYRLRKFWRFGLTEGSSSASIRASAKSAMSSEKNAILRKKSLIQSDPIFSLKLNAQIEAKQCEESLATIANAALTHYANLFICICCQLGGPLTRLSHSTSPLRLCLWIHFNVLPCTLLQCVLLREHIFSAFHKFSSNIS